MIPAGVILFVVFVLTVLVAAALGKNDGFRQQERGDRGHG